MIWRIFLPIADKLKNFYPEVKRNLMQSGSKENIRDFIAKNLFYSFIIFITITAIFIQRIKIGLIVSITVSSIIYGYLMNIPKLKILRKRRSIESKLIFALDQMRIKISSGVSLVEAIKGIASSNFGELSNESADIARKIEGGMPEVDAIEDTARKCSSPIARRVLWEIATSIRSGGDIKNVLDAVISNMVKELQIKMKSYAGVLNTYLLLYMVLSIVLPVLLIIAFIVISIISNIQIPIIIIYSIPVLIIIFQFVIIGLIKTKRPYLWSE